MGKRNKLRLKNKRRKFEYEGEGKNSNTVGKVAVVKKKKKKSKDMQTNTVVVKGTNYIYGVAGRTREDRKKVTFSAQPEVIDGWELCAMALHMFDHAKHDVEITVSGKPLTEKEVLEISAEHRYY